MLWMTAGATNLGENRSEMQIVARVEAEMKKHAFASIGKTMFTDPRWEHFTMATIEVSGDIGGLEVAKLQGTLHNWIQVSYDHFDLPVLKRLIRRASWMSDLLWYPLFGSTCIMHAVSRREVNHRGHCIPPSSRPWVIVDCRSMALIR